MARLGERIAERFLVAHGARIVARNLRLWPGEVDLLARIGSALVLVEVKTRAGADPAEAFTVEKAERLRRTGSRMRRRPDRYDLVTVRLSASGAEVRWLPAVC